MVDETKMQQMPPWERLAAAREAAGYASAAAFAREVEMSPSSYAAYENGGRRIHEDVAPVFAKKLGIKAAEIIESKRAHAERKGKANAIKHPNAVRRVYRGQPRVRQTQASTATNSPELPLSTQTGNGVEKKVQGIKKVYSLDGKSALELTLFKQGRSPLRVDTDALTVDVDTGAITFMPIQQFLTADRLYHVTQQDDSMVRDTHPSIRDGAIVFVDLDRKPTPGDFVLATIKHATEKVVRRYRQQYEASRRQTADILEALNPDYADYEMLPDDEIIGTVVAINQTEVLVRGT